MKKPSHIFAQAGLIAVLALASGLIAAQPSGEGGGRRAPPPEALAACKSLSSGQECSFTSPRGTASGTCWAPTGMPLACKPKDAPNDGGRPARH